MKKIVILCLTCMIFFVINIPLASATPFTEYNWLYKDFESNAPIGGSIYGSTTITRVSGGAGGSAGAAQIDVTSNNGGVRFPFHIQKNQKYRLSVWIKVVGELPKTNRIRFMMYYPAQASSVQLYREVAINDITFSKDQWMHYETYYTHDGRGQQVGVGAQDGADGPAQADIRLGLGTLADTDGISINYLMDDFMIEPVAEDGAVDLPEVSNLEIIGEPLAGSVLTFNCQYNGAEPNVGLIKILRSTSDGNWVSVGAAQLTQTITYDITADDVGNKIKFEVLPIDADGNIGNIASITTETVSDIFGVYAKFTSGFDSTIDAEVRVDNNLEDCSVIIMLCLFDQNNAMCGMSEKSVSVPVNQSITETITITPTSDGQTARLFVWEGASAVDTTMVSLKSNVLLTK